MSAAGAQQFSIADTVRERRLRARGEQDVLHFLSDPDAPVTNQAEQD